jgi:hypothetical protein
MLIRERKEKMEAIFYLVWFVLGIALIIAQLRLFSIDATLKAILAEMKKSGVQPGDQPAPAVTQLDRERIADIQKNWPGY